MNKRLVTSQFPRKGQRFSVSISRSTVTSALTCALVLLALGTSAALASPVQLVLPQSAAFGILGHSCGGIQEQAYATGFIAGSGDPTGTCTSKRGVGEAGGAVVITPPRIRPGSR